MEPNNRAPIYNTDKTGRIVSGPGNTWRWETYRLPGTKEKDGWDAAYSYDPDFARSQARLTASNKAIAEASKKSA